MSFFEAVARRAREVRSHVCVGLDPRVSRASELVPEAMRVVEATQARAAAFKPNAAFFEAFGAAGVSALEEVVRRIPPEVPCLLDAKRGDIGATNAAYGKAARALGAGALTVSPYLGVGALEPFLSGTVLDLFVLARTSNPEAERVQDARLAVGGTLYERVVRDVVASPYASRLGLVVGATEPRAIARVRALAPAAWLLLPGVGAQGGDLEAAVEAARREDGSGFLVNVSRSVADAADPGAYVASLADTIERAAARPVDPTRADGRAAFVDRLARTLFDAEVVRFGSFTLKSGIESPIYVDLRRLVTFPRALAEVADVLASMLEGLVFDRIAALPYAALPIGTAVAMRMDRPLVYPRAQAKTYGAKASIEGLFHEGERVVVLDDIATRGDAKLEAMGPLASAGLRVEDVVVLVDREQGARALLAERGVRLHAAVTLRELVRALEGLGKIDVSERDRVLRFLDGEAA